MSFRAKKPPTCWRAGIRLGLTAFTLTVCGSGITAQEIPQPLATRLAAVPQRDGAGTGRLNVPGLAAPGNGAVSAPQNPRPLGAPRQQSFPQQRNSPRRGLNGLRLPYLPELPRGLGTPKSDPFTRERYSRFVTEELDPEQTLTLVVNRPKVLRFREAPVRTYIPEAGSNIIALRYVDPASATHVAIEPLETGSTVLSMWFKDPTAPGGQQYLSWMVNVVEDPEQGRRLEAVYAALEREINQNFPNSVVRLSLVGDKLLVRGQAKDIQDASQILRIVGSNAPGGPEAVPVRNVDLNLVSGLNPNGNNAFDDGEIQSLLLRTAEQDAVEAGSTVINMLRVAGEQQVNLKVIVAEVNRDALRAIGANMSLGPGNSTSFMSAFGTPSIVQGLNSNIMSAEGGTFGINRGDFQLAVNALRGLGYARTLAEPNVVSLNGQPAIFRAGDTFPVPASNVSFGAAAQSVSQQFVGVQIRFLPVITDNDRVRLQLSGTVSTLDNSLQANIGGANVPGTNTRNFFTTVELREGQTLALAGLISRSSQGNSSRVPLLGDVPGLGRLFTLKTTSRLLLASSRKLTTLPAQLQEQAECPGPMLPATQLLAKWITLLPLLAPTLQIHLSATDSNVCRTDSDGAARRRFPRGLFSSLLKL